MSVSKNVMHKRFMIAQPQTLTRIFLLVVGIFIIPSALQAQESDVLPTRALLLSAPDNNKVDEFVEIFQSDKVHLGMDEVFILGEDICPRFAGKDKAKLFAGEVTHIHNHLSAKGIGMWMWGDRLIDANTSGLNKWRASMNGTHPAIDLIPKEVVVFDWQYPTAEATAYYFALQGFRV